MKFGNFHSLSLKKEILTLNSQGFFLKSRSFNYKFLESEENKAIFIVRKKIGISPTRNRIKRKLRAIIAKNSNLLIKKINIMIIVKSDILTNFSVLEDDFINIISKINKKLIS